MADFDITPNITIPAGSDKMGFVWVTVKNALVASGLWRVRGSGDGQSAVALVGQTSGPSYDVFTGNGGLGYQTDGIANTGSSAYPNTMSRNRAWLCMEEISSGRCFVVIRNPNNGATAELFTGTWDFWFADAVGTSGATATAPPAAVRGKSPQSVSMTLNASNTSTAPTNFAVFKTDSISTAVLHMWMPTELTGDVAPWAFLVWDPVNSLSWCIGFWESLVDEHSSSGRTYMMANFGSVGLTVGNPLQGLISGSPSSIHGPTGSGSLTGRKTSGGANNRELNAVALLTISNFRTYAYNATSQLAQQDVTYRTERLMMRDALSRARVGRTEHFFWNPLLREYPTTYNLTDGPAYVSIGYLLLPWPTGEVPAA